jgi:hypothetical protein
MLNVVYGECCKHAHYFECHCANYRYAECRYAECRYAGCRGAAKINLEKFCWITSLVIFN